MAKKGRRKGKHIPQRTCVGCRQVGAKAEFMRLVRTPEGMLPDPSGKMNGRGAYVHANQDCFQRALRGSLAGALRISLSAQDRERLEALMRDMPPERPAQEIVGSEQDN